MDVGIDFASGVELAGLTGALSTSSSPTGAGAARLDTSTRDASPGQPMFTDTAFFLYYDDVEEKYMMRDPLVVAPDGTEVECEKPDDLERGERYYCVVTMADGKYAAEVLMESEADEKDAADYDAMWKVHLFNVPKASDEDEDLGEEEEPGYEDGMQYHTGAIVVGSGGGGGVTPDDVSTEFIPDPPSGTSSDGDEGRLQVKGFKTGTPADTNTVTDYLQGVVNIPSGGISFVCRNASNSTRTLFYLPLAQLFSSASISGNVSLSYVAGVRKDDVSNTYQRLVNSVNLRNGQVTPGNWESFADCPPPGNFEPVFAEDQSDHKVKLVGVGQGFCPFGRLFYQTVNFDNSANIDKGYIYLEVDHPASSQSSPTVYVKGNATRPDFANPSDTSKSLIPLYYIDDGRIEIDFRSCMSLTIREF